MSRRDEIIAAHPIVEFLRSHGHELKERGENFETNACPITQHSRRGHTPVTIYPATQTWTCHDCKRTGSVIDWVMLEKNIGAREGMRQLSDDAPIVATYDYTDENGTLLFQAVRTKPRDKTKDFYQRQPDGKGGWINNIKGVRRVLYRLPEVIKAQTVIVVEGEKDADKLRELGFTATTNPMGAGKWRKEYAETLRGKDAVVFGDVGDADGSGEKHTAKVLMSLNGIAKSRKHGKQPKRFHDISDYIVSLRLKQLPKETIAEAIAELIKNAETVREAEKSTDVAVPPPESIPARLNSPLPKVQLPGDNRLLSAFADECAQILKSRGIYQLGGIAMIVNDECDGLEVITPAMLRTLAERYLVCYHIKRTRDGDLVEFSRTMSTDAAQGVLSAKQFLSHLPKVDRIATTRLPIMRKTGAIELLPNGYDAQSKTLTLSQCDYDETLPLKKAIETIDDLFSEFPFADAGRSKAVAIAAADGLYAAGLITRKTLRPVFIYVTNAEGAGKTLLAMCAITPTHGETKIDSELEDPVETKKELVAAVIEARPYILFDNVKGHLNSPALEGFTSSTRFSGRILGVSKMFVGQNDMTVFITGNGCTVTPDMRRRSLFVELRMEEEHAEDRVFKRELDQSVLLDLRPEILAALWALVREWDAAGRPKPSRSHNAFPEWSRIIGGIVEFAGYGCPFATADIDDAGDTEGADMHKLAKLIARREPIKFDELIELAREHGLFEWIISDNSELKPSQRSKIGKLLKRYNRRLFTDGRFVISGKGRFRTFQSIGSIGSTGVQVI